MQLTCQSPIWGVADFLWATDRPQLHLEQDLQLRAVRAGQTCLDSYSHLCFINFTNKRLNYKLRPEWSHNQILFFCRSSSATTSRNIRLSYISSILEIHICKYFTPPYVEWCLGLGGNFFFWSKFMLGRLFCGILLNLVSGEKTPYRTLVKYPPEACVCTYGLGLEKFE